MPLFYAALFDDTRYADTLRYMLYIARCFFAAAATRCFMMMVDAMPLLLPRHALPLLRLRYYL